MLLGGPIRVPGLFNNRAEGGVGFEEIALKGPVVPGSQRVLQGRGPVRVGGTQRGNLVVHLKLNLPRQLSNRQIVYYFTISNFISSPILKKKSCFY